MHLAGLIVGHPVEEGLHRLTEYQLLILLIQNLHRKGRSNSNLADTPSLMH